MKSFLLILFTASLVPSAIQNHTIEYEKGEEVKLMNTEKPPEPGKHIENYFNATQREIKGSTNSTYYDTGDLKPHSELNHTKLIQNSIPLTDRKIVIQKRFLPLLGLLLQGASILVPMIMPDIIPDFLPSIVKLPQTPTTRKPRNIRTTKKSKSSRNIRKKRRTTDSTNTEYTVDVTENTTIDYDEYAESTTNYDDYDYESTGSTKKKKH